MKNLEDVSARNHLQDTFKQITSFLWKISTKLDDKEFEISDILNIESYGMDTLETVPKKVRVGGADRSKSNTKTNGKKGKTSGSGGDGTFKKSGNAIAFNAVAVPTSKRSYEIYVKLNKASVSQEIRFSLDEGMDDTCYGANVEEYVILNNIKINGKKANNTVLVKDGEEKTLGISLGKLTRKLMLKSRSILCLKVVL